MKKEDQEQLNFSRNILDKLIVIAKEVFNNYLVFNTDNVTLSAKEVTNYIQNNKLEFNDSIFNHLEYTVTEGTFSCKFDCRNIFILVEKFEKLAKIKQSEKTMFVCGKGIQAKLNVKCYFVEDKTNKTVCRKRTINRIREDLSFVTVKNWDNVLEDHFFFLIDNIWYEFYVCENSSNRIEAMMKKTKTDIIHALKNWPFPIADPKNKIFHLMIEKLMDNQDTEVTETTNVSATKDNQDTEVTETTNVSATKDNQDTEVTEVTEVANVPATKDNQDTEVTETSEVTEVTEVANVPATKDNQGKIITFVPSVVVTDGKDLIFSIQKQTYLCKFSEMKLPELQLSG